MHTARVIISIAALCLLAYGSQPGAQATATVQTPASAAAPAPRPVPPTRDPHTPGYVNATELPDGTVPGTDVDGDFIIGPTHNPASDMAVRDDVPHGRVCALTMSSADSKIYPGISPDAGT